MRLVISDVHTLYEDKRFAIGRKFFIADAPWVFGIIVTTPPSQEFGSGCDPLRNALAATRRY